MRLARYSWVSGLCWKRGLARPCVAVWLACALSLATTAGCSSSDSPGAGITSDAGADVAQDGAADTSQDAAQDVAPDVNVTPPDECDVIAQNCPDGQKCTFTQVGGVAAARCVDTIGDAGIDEECQRPNGVLGEDTCAKGGFCAYWDVPQSNPQLRKCLPLCRTSDDCEAGNHCEEITTAEHVGVCVVDCDPFDDTCITGTTCRALLSFNNEIGFVCFPEGPAGVDEVCSNSVNCQKGLDCVGSEGGSRCYPPCDSDHPCDNGITCATVSGTAVPGHDGFGTCMSGDQGPADPCSWANVNDDVGACQAGLTCVGSLGTTSCTTDADCEAPGWLNARCVNGKCGDSWCTSVGCTDAQDCEAGFGAGACCQAIGTGDNACHPHELCASQTAGQPCSTKATDGTIVNPNAGLCASGLSCFSSHDASKTCTTDADCGGPGVNGCFDGACGHSYCSAVGGCSVAADCTADYGANACCLLVNGRADMTCGPVDVCPAVGSQGLGQACNSDPINPTAGDCQLDLVCGFTYLDDTHGPAVVPCTVDADCGSDPGSWGCFGGFCGRSLCTRTCSADADCTTWGTGACCRDGWCLPSDECTVGTAGPGDPCDSTLYGVSGTGDCQSGLLCVGYYAPPQSDHPLSCTGDAECQAVLGAGAVCHNGSCAVTNCTEKCTADADCEADFGTGSCCVSSGCATPEVCAHFNL